MTKSSWVMIGLALLLVTLFLGCGGTQTAPPQKGGGLGEGPQMPEGQKSPLLSGSADEAEKTGHGPGRGGPAGYDSQGQQDSEGPPGGGPTQGP